jgi:hypothetical protein
MNSSNKYPDCDSCAFRDAEHVICDECEDADQWEPDPDDMEDEDGFSGSYYGTVRVVKMVNKRKRDEEEKAVA